MRALPIALVFCMAFTAYADELVRFVEASDEIRLRIVNSWLVEGASNNLSGVRVSANSSFGDLNGLQFLPQQGGWFSLSGHQLPGNDFYTYEFQIPKSLVLGAKFRVGYTDADGKITIVTFGVPNDL